MTAPIFTDDLAADVADAQEVMDFALLDPPFGDRSIATRNGSISLPYCTPDGQAVSHARQSKHNSRCRRTSRFNSNRPSVTARIK